MTETELFLTSIKNCRRIDLYVDAPPLSLQEKNLLSSMERRRTEGEPLQYILGYTEFYGLKILVDTRVLIPRFETELLVDAVLKIVKTNSRRPSTILDVGTGSGNIAIALAKNIEGCRVVALDISEDALDLARQNAKINAVENKIEFLQSDLLSGFPTTGRVNGKFDIIVSNPPYIKSGDWAKLPGDVQKEPSLALDGGVDGLVVYRRLIAEGQVFLKSGGFLIVECADGQGAAIKEIFQEQEGFEPIEVRKDFNQQDRIIIAQRF